MADVTRATKDLVIANRTPGRIVGIVEAFGDISVRHPSDPARFFLAGAVSPAAVARSDVVEFALDGAAVAKATRPLPPERFIHAAIYEARPDVRALLHASPEDVLPFGITPTALRPMIASVGDIGLEIPVWDIAKKFGGATGLQVSTREQARDLARCLGRNRVVLLRGEGIVVTGRTLNDVVRLSAYIPRNGRAIMAAKPLGKLSGLSRGEVDDGWRSTGIERHAAGLGILGAAGRMWRSAVGLVALAAPLSTAIRYAQGSRRDRSRPHGTHEGLMGEKTHYRLSALQCAVTVISVVVAAGAASADAVSDFYKGKSVSLIAGFPPGGGYDTYVRVLARHYGRLIPGQPSVVPSNMPGAGSLLAANNIYGKAAPDGLSMAMFASSAVMEPLLGNKAALFDATKFSWIGSMSQDVSYCGVWQTPGAAQTFDEMMTKETIFGGGAVSAITFQHPMVLKNMLRANIRVIPGYPGSRELNLAMHRGEVNGVCGLFGSSIKAQFNDDVKSGRLKLVIQMGSKTSAEFGKIPSVFDYAKTDEDRAVLDVHFRQLLLGRPLAGPPGIPPDRLKALREALAATLKDKDFLAERTRPGSTSTTPRPRRWGTAQALCGVPTGSFSQGARGDRPLTNSRSVRTARRRRPRCAPCAGAADSSRWRRSAGSTGCPRTRWRPAPSATGTDIRGLAPAGTAHRGCARLSSGSRPSMRTVNCGLT